MFADCPKCQQKLKAEWHRCPRCKMSIPKQPVAAEASAQEPRSRAWIALLVVGAIATAGVAGSGVFSAPESGAAPTAVESSTSASSSAGSGKTRRPSGPGEGAADRTASAHVAIDAKRSGKVAYATGDFAGALQQYEAAVEAAPDDAEAQNNLGQMLVRLGRTKDAIPHFDAAVTIDGDEWSYRFNRARAYGLLNQWKDAAAEYRVATRLFPEDHATAFNLGLALLRVPDYPEAVRALEHAVSIAPEETGFLITLGTAYVGAKQSDRARATFEKFLEVAPSDSEAPRVRSLLEAMTAAGQ